MYEADLAVKILVIEDDLDINELLCTILQRAGYVVERAFNGREGLAKFEACKDLALVLLDLMLPGKMGEDVIKEIRKTSLIPIIAVSGKAYIADKVRVFDLGGDDYITKPFHKEEILSRVRAALRRRNIYDQVAEKSKVKNELETGEIKVEKLSINLGEHVAKYGDKPLDLTQTQFALLKVFMQNPRHAFTRDQLYREIWGEETYQDDNTINVHVSNLRKKLKEISGKDIIITVWGIGYKLVL